VLATLCGGSGPSAQKHSQNDNKNVHKQGATRGEKFVVLYCLHTHPPWEVLLHGRELINNSVCAVAPVLKALKHSQNNDKNIHDQGEKTIPHKLCRNMCQRHQNWFRRIPGGAGK